MNLIVPHILKNLRVICLAYASVIFSTSLFTGLVIIGTTLLLPLQGSVGLLGGIIALVCARLAGFSEKTVIDGRLIYNPILSSLALACWYPIDASNTGSFLLLLVVVSIASLILSLIVNHYSVLLNGITAMSLPFSIVGIGLHWFLLQRGCGWIFPPAQEASDVLSIVRSWCLSVAEISFVPTLTSGVIISMALLWSSRISFLNGCLGLIVAQFFLGTVGFSEADSSWLYLDCMLTAIALGGVFYVPSRSSFILAGLGSALCATLGIALMKGFAFIDAPVLTLPFVITTIGFVSALRWRSQFQFPRPVTFEAKSPEAAFQASRLYHTRYEDAQLPRIAPPFDGCWTVTQGFAGGITHRGPWQYALDFEVTSVGDRLRPNSAELTDFPSFDAPIIAPCVGRVVQVIDDVKDNAVGKSNLAQNWGNLVVIEINPQLYVFLCHFRQRGIKVREGERVKQGQLLGYLGNSGRSPFPHLHMHLQTSPELGAPTIPFRLRGYRTAEEGFAGGRFHFSGLPQTGETIIGSRSTRWLTQTADHWAGDEQTCRIMSSRGGDAMEHLRLSAEPYGVLCWQSSSPKAEYRAQILDGVLTPLSFEGSEKSLLRLLWLVGRIPLAAHQEMTWTEAIEPSFDTPYWLKLLTLLVAPFIPNHTRSLRGKITGFDPERELYQLSCIVDSKVRGKAPSLSLEFIFGAGLSLISIRKESATGWLRSHAATAPTPTACIAASPFSPHNKAIMRLGHLHHAIYEVRVSGRQP